MFKIYISTAGIGSRLGKLTEYTNKCMVRIGNKPAISHIIESYPENSNFVIGIGYKGTIVTDFLKIAYPDYNFEFANVDKFHGKGSSLLYSMFCAKDKLLCPFIFHAADTIITQIPPSPEFKNWNAGYKTKDTTNYTSFNCSNNTIIRFNSKGSLDSDYSHIGLVGIKDFKLFWKISENYLKNNPDLNEANDVTVLKEFILEKKIEPFFPDNWFDIGNVLSLKSVRSKFKDSSFNVLEKPKESIYLIKKNIIKFFADKNLSIKRAKRVEFLKGVVPGKVVLINNFYSYEYIDGQLLSEINDINVYSNFLKWSKNNLWKKVKSNNKIDKNKIITKFYIDKTHERVNNLHRIMNIKDEKNVINGVRVPPLNDLLDLVDVNFLTETELVTFHGDFILDNIIYNKKNDTYTAIDWRQDFGGNIESGDIYYDLAKQMHNLTINHDIVDKNLFTIKKSENIIEVDILRKNYLIDFEKIFIEFVKKHDYNLDKILILRSIIWLNMSPLHHSPFNLFLYYLGKLNLYKILKKINQ